MEDIIKKLYKFKTYEPVIRLFLTENKLQYDPYYVNIELSPMQTYRHIQKDIELNIKYHYFLLSYYQIPKKLLEILIDDYDKLQIEFEEIKRGDYKKYTDDLLSFVNKRREELSFCFGESEARELEAIKNKTIKNYMKLMY
jgi:hypothetical protein